MKIETAKGLEKQVKEAARTLEATERLIRDLQIQVSTVQDDDTLKRLEMRRAERKQSAGSNRLNWTFNGSEKRTHYDLARLGLLWL